MNRKKYGFVLYPLSWIYAFVVGIRHLFYNLGIFSSKEFDLPILCVGNITVGGTGKTPHVEAIVRILKEHYNVAVLSRGYKRKSKGYKEVFVDSKVIEVGDEPLQIKQKFPDITVAVSENRRKGIQTLMKKNDPKIDVIILDDGYQHLAVKAGIYILLVDFNNPIYEDKMLPYGTLRESIHHKSKAHMVIVTNTPTELKPIERRIIQKKLELFPYQYLFFSYVKYKSPVVVFPEYQSVIKYNFSKFKYVVLLVTGIANPKPLHDNIKRFASDIIEITFPDHYYFKSKDIRTIVDTFNSIREEKKIIITTEKDSIRLREAPNNELLFDLPIFYIPIEIDFLYDEKNKFNLEIIEYVRKNQPISNIYTRKNKLQP
ncbi:MAG: tetraacyldisaccharide 4'-kinase [Bacteroidales bacterium]